jgi:hypothetical protein
MLQWYNTGPQLHQENGVAACLRMLGLVEMTMNCQSRSKCTVRFFFHAVCKPKH